MGFTSKMRRLSTCHTFLNDRGEKDSSKADKCNAKIRFHKSFLPELTENVAWTRFVVTQKQGVFQENCVYSFLKRGWDKQERPH